MRPLRLARAARRVALLLAPSPRPWALSRTASSAETKLP